MKKGKKSDLLCIIIIWKKQKQELYMLVKTEMSVEILNNIQIVKSDF